MASLWPDAFDEHGNKSDWRYEITDEYISPSTGDLMYVTATSPRISDRMKWLEEHKDAIHWKISEREK